MTLPTAPRRRKPQGRHPKHALSTAFVRNVSEAGRYCDGDGLYLEVKPTGTRSWIQRLAIRGRRREIGLGGFPLVPLKEARAQALANRRLARAGGDPLAEKRRAKSMPTFADAAERVWNQMRPGWRNQKHIQNWISGLRRFAFPRIGKIPVSEVTSADLIEALRPVWHVRPSTARRVRQRIGTVMEFAVAMEYRDDNPCDRIGPALGPQRDLVKHMQALPHGEVAAAIATVRATGATAPVKLTFEFLVLTAARSGEVRGALWTEIDLTDRVWTIPPTRMKATREHRVPLSGRAMQILNAARTLGNGVPLVFPGQGGKPISQMRLPKLLHNYGIVAVPHGFRSSFRDWAAEETDHPREVVEAALAHVVGNRTEAAYARSDLFERRRRLMDDWSAYLGGGGHLPMIAHLDDRAAALMARGWTRREAEWLALVCLHSGVFLRSQYLAFIGRTNPALAHRFIRRCRKYAVEQPWNGSRIRLCRIAARRIYRVLGVEHIRHRRAAGRCPAGSRKSAATVHSRYPAFSISARAPSSSSR